jgi:hypothetical protein
MERVQEKLFWEGAAYQPRSLSPEPGNQYYIISKFDANEDLQFNILILQYLY